MPNGRVRLDRALSKLNILSRAQAIEAIRAGRVIVNGRIILDPGVLVWPERASIAVDGQRQRRAPWRTILFHKPRGVVTTRHDPEGRRTIYDVLGSAGVGLIPIGRLDFATSGLLLLTNDTRLADWITDPCHDVARVYVVTTRGSVTESDLLRLKSGVTVRGEQLRAHAVRLRKKSTRESHLMIELREGKYREIRRLLDALGHPVRRLKRVRLGGLELDVLEPGQWRDVSTEEIANAFPGAIGRYRRSAPAVTPRAPARSGR
ncbi:MAG: pseudouridine synthase [Blastocatellia bacterium]|nr:MAG: pseudouridine synthase [Blastocatellia bacterium]